MRGSTGAGAEREQRTRFGCKQYGTAAVPAGRGGGFVLPKRHLSKGEYDRYTEPAVRRLGFDLRFRPRPWLRKKGRRTRRPPFGFRNFYKT